MCAYNWLFYIDCDAVVAKCIFVMSNQFVISINLRLNKKNAIIYVFNLLDYSKIGI